MHDGRYLIENGTGKKLLLEFWSDFQPHSVHEFRDYLKKNNITIVDRTHISSAVYTATQQGILVRVDRGNYQAGINFHEDIEIPMKKMAGIQSVLLQTKRVLSIPINIVELTPKERELIPRLFAEDCAIYASELTCYYRPSERICVLPKGKTHKTKWRIL